MTLWVRVGLALALALLAIAVPKLALPAALFTLLSALAAPKLEAPSRRRYVVGHAVAGVLATIAVARFLATEALAGIVQGGTSFAGGRAISRLREILFAEDGARKTAAWDPDGDHVGSALFLGELTGEAGVRGGVRLSEPLIERYPKVETTSTGPAIEIGGFWFAVCLPARAGGLTADPAVAVDDERAERAFIAYAWPSGRAPGLERAYFLDEHERILSAPSSPGVRSGAEHGPDCNDALAEPTRGAWTVWRGKKPRADLPGDRAP